MAHKSWLCQTHADRFFFFSFSLICSYEALRECINKFLVHLCFHFEDRNEEFATYIRELLHTALPHIDCKYKCKTNLFID